jgi:hypothetical protein
VGDLVHPIDGSNIFESLYDVRRFQSIGTVMVMAWLQYNSLILKNREDFGCTLCGRKRESLSRKGSMAYSM